MTTRRLVRLVLGILVAGALLALLLPFVGVPASHYLPPARVYATAQGETRGYVVSKYYEATGNPFHVGEQLYFLNYEFKAPAPPPRGMTTPGPAQNYQGTLHTDTDTYHKFALPTGEANTTFIADQPIPLTPFPVRVKYEKTYPEISGIDATWGGRSMGAGSNVLSGWLIWLFVALFLGYLLMFVFDKFGGQEDI